MKIEDTHKKWLILLAGILLFSGCAFEEDINVDPNATTSEVVGLNNRLPALQYRMGRLQGRAIAIRIGNIMGYTLYKQGPTGFNTYVFSSADASNINMWNDMYSGVINQAKQIIDVANEEGNNYYRGIARILLAYNTITATTIWGDVPYSQVAQAFAFPFPKFDTQESIYSGVQNLLDQAIADLSAAAPTRKPANDDLIFKGDVSKWLKTAYGLKARYYLHLVKIDESNYTKAETALTSALQSNADNMQLQFENGVPDVAAPLSQEKISGDTDVDPQFGLLLRNTLADPREKFYAIVRVSLLTGTRAVYGAYYSSQNSYFPFLTFEECKFMQAEIAMKKSGKAAAEPFLREAVAASLNRVCSRTIGSDDNGDLATAIPTTAQVAYVNKVANIDSVATDEQAWRAIFQQKYIAMFMQPEAWNDYRRTEKYVDGLAGLPAITGREGKAIPRRLFYPSTELNANPSAPPNIPDIYTRVWWDTP